MYPSFSSSIHFPYSTVGDSVHSRNHATHSFLIQYKFLTEDCTITTVRNSGFHTLWSRYNDGRRFQSDWAVNYKHIKFVVNRTYLKTLPTALCKAIMLHVCIFDDNTGIIIEFTL